VALKLSLPGKLGRRMLLSRLTVVLKWKPFQKREKLEQII
jgi:hypothetical protein